MLRGKEEYRDGELETTTNPSEGDNAWELQNTREYCVYLFQLNQLRYVKVKGRKKGKEKTCYQIAEGKKSREENEERQIKGSGYGFRSPPGCRKLFKVTRSFCLFLRVLLPPKSIPPRGNGHYPMAQALATL
jgi:hypothetical protein